MDSCDVSEEKIFETHSMPGLQSKEAFSESLSRPDETSKMEPAMAPHETKAEMPNENKTEDFSANTMEPEKNQPEHNPLSQPGLTLDPEFLHAAAINKGDKNAEWQFDSSDAESSSADSNSSDSSSEEDSDEEEYELLDPEEQARILMEDAGSDDEGQGKGQRGASGAVRLRTKNEQPDEEIEKPNLSVTPDMNIQELGSVEHIVENLILIKAKVSGEYQVLESGSVVCLENRAVVGVIADTLGRVEQPLYSVRFQSADEINELGITAGKSIFYVEGHSSFVFTQPLKALKGSDASNLHDEEVGDEEVEFSDDEAEAEYKKRLKQERQARKVSKLGTGNGSNRRPAIVSQRPVNKTSHEEDLYTPLARPSNLQEMMARGEASVESKSSLDAPNYSKPSRGSKGFGRDYRRQRHESGPRHKQPRGPAPGKDDMFQYPSSTSSIPNHDTTNRPSRVGPSLPYSGFAQHASTYNAQGTTPQPPLPFPQFYPQPFAWPQGYAPAAHQFFANQNMLPQSMFNSNLGIQPGAFINPGFFINQQPLFGPQPTQQPSQPAAGQASSDSSGQQTPYGEVSQARPIDATVNEADAESAFRAAQEKLDILRGLSQNTGA